MTASPNQERNDEIIRRYMSGETIRKISKEMNLTRNTVIGVNYRAGLSVTHEEDWLVGSNNPSAKLTEADVLDIRKRLIPGGMGDVKSVAASYGVSPQAIYKIVLRRTWKHI